MARPRKDDARREMIPLRLSKDELAAIDAARGQQGRSAWLRDAIAARLAGVLEALPAERKPFPFPPSPPPLPVWPTRSGEPARPTWEDAVQEDCPHPSGAWDSDRAVCTLCGWESDW